MKVIFALIISSAVCLAVYGQQAEPDKTTPKANATQAPTPVDSDEELRRAIESSNGNETQLVVNLEEYLKKFPKSARRAEIESEVFKMSVKLHDSNRAIAYAEKMIAADSGNIDALTNIIGLLRERKAEGDLNKALVYADQLVKEFEELLSTSVKPKRLSSAQWKDRKDRGLASVYLMRGMVYADLNNFEKAQSDMLKSFNSGRLAGASLALAELAEKRKKDEEALDYYLQAFVIALNDSQEIDFKKVRGKLSQLYTAKHGSDAGLGDRLLKVYDNYVKERADRTAKLEQPNINAGVTDLRQFKLTRLDGSILEMDSLRDKVVVMNFWATWCGPCLSELPLFEKTIEKYKDDKDVVFLAVSTDEDRDQVQPFLKQHKMNLPVTYADYLNDFFTVSSIPTTIILDRKGAIAFRQAGYNSREDFIVMLSGKIEAAKK